MTTACGSQKNHGRAESENNWGRLAPPQRDSGQLTDLSQSQRSGEPMEQQGTASQPSWALTCGDEASEQ